MAYFQFSENSQPVHVRHDQIEEDEGELVAARTVQKIKRGLAAGRGDDRHSGACNGRFEQPALYGIVIHDEYRLSHVFL
jgi:hypothetical protein